MTYKNLIIKKYPEIKKAVVLKAFKFHVDSKDLLSTVNERIAVNIYNERFTVNHEAQFWRYIHSIIYTCAVDLKRRTKGDFELLENCYKADGFNLINTLSAKLLINKILGGIKNETHKKAVIEILIHGEQYEDTADKLGLKLTHIKTIIFKTRERANHKYRKAYNEILN